MQAEALFETATEKVIPKKGQRSNRNHQHSSSGDSAFGATCPKRVPGEMGC